jgi:hypothetical protein
MLDFIGASTYFTDLSTSPVQLGSDGNLIHEFMEIERIMLEQSRSIGSAEYPLGSYQPYVCRVAGVIGNMGINHECLDIASPKTMRITSQNVETGAWNVTYTTTTGQLLANQFVHTNVMVDINTGVSNTLPSDVMDMFGSNVTQCGPKPAEREAINGKIIGDGVINSFDLYVIAAAQFRQGPYATLQGVPFASVATVQGRPDTKDRCCMENPDCPGYDRLEWQKRVAYKDCFSYTVDEGDYQQDTQAGRRVQEAHASMSGVGLDNAWSLSISPTVGLLPAPLTRRVSPLPIFNTYAPAPPVNERLVLQDALSSKTSYSLNANGKYTHIQSTAALHGFSDFGIYNKINATHTRPVTATTVQYQTPYEFDNLGDNGAVTKELGASITVWSTGDEGTWYWINIPAVHIALELSLSSFGTHDGIAISNERAPNYMEYRVPYHTNKPNLRFMRHREFYAMDTAECAPVHSNRRSSTAMENGVIYIGQSTKHGTKLCGFDVVVWKPANDAKLMAPDAPTCVLSGSVGMNGAGGSVQTQTSCATHEEARNNPPGSPPSPLALPSPSTAATTQYSVKFVVTIDMNASEFERASYKAGLADALSTEVAHISLNVTTYGSLIVETTVTFNDTATATRALNIVSGFKNESGIDELSDILNVTASQIESVEVEQEIIMSSNHPSPPISKEQSSSDSNLTVVMIVVVVLCVLAVASYVVYAWYANKKPYVAYSEKPIVGPVASIRVGLPDAGEVKRPLLALSRVA